jgi:putative ATP-dependent endonuclease of OLD family
MHHYADSSRRNREFPGIAKGCVSFPEHALLVGPNNAGKSTVLEALDLALGPDRLSGAGTIDEHDFYQGAYLPDQIPKTNHPAADDGESEHESTTPVEEKRAPRIVITVTLGNLAEEELSKFRSHVEPWNREKSCVLPPEEAGSREVALSDYVLRIRFSGWYDTEEDEFKAETVFLNPALSDDRFEPVNKRQKQMIGFLYLRSLRTGRRAASLQRGSLMDVLMNLAKAKPKFWHELICGLGALGEKASQDSGVRAILDDLETALGAYLPRPVAGSCSPSRLNVTQLTRENLRTAITFFLASAESGHLLPFDHQGSGTTNILVLALLSLIAKCKANVIFAMEEPEIAIGPTVQRRIVANLKQLAGQAILTSHSPYVAEQMLPDQIVVLRRRSDGLLSSKTATATAKLKEKILRVDFRKKYAEGLVGNAVLVVEGITETYALPAASDILAEVPDTAYRTLDLLGVVPVCADGDGDLAKAASFFHGAGISTYVFCGP